MIQNSKVAVLGAAGGIGQPLSLLMKLNPRVSKLALYDIRLAPGPFVRSLQCQKMAKNSRRRS